MLSFRVTGKPVKLLDNVLADLNSVAFGVTDRSLDPAFPDSIIISIHRRLF